MKGGNKENRMEEREEAKKQGSKEDRRKEGARRRKDGREEERECKERWTGEGMGDRRVGGSKIRMRDA